MQLAGLSPFIAVRDHFVVEGRDGCAAGFDAEERKNPVQNTSHARHQHFRAKTKGCPHMLDVGFTNGGRVVCKIFHRVPVVEQGKPQAIGNLYNNCAGMSFGSK